MLVKRHLRLLATGLAATAVLGACSQPDLIGPPAPTSNATTAAIPSPAPSPEPVGPPSPITGEPVAAEAQHRRVLAVKIDNHRDARPQTNLGLADEVVEIIVEGGMTRFVAIFHHSDTTYLGPMRSGRPTDGTVLKPLGATLAVSGGQEWVKDRLRESVPLIDDPGKPMTFRVSERKAPHNLFVNTIEMRAEATRRGYSDEAPLSGLWTYGPLPVGQDITELTLDWSDSAKVTWSWNGSAWQRSQDGVAHNWRDEDGAEHRITADSLIVLIGRQYGASVPGEGPIPAIETTGSGRALVASGGRIVDGTWERADSAAPFELRTADGQVLTVPPGSPWLSVFPQQRPITFQ